MTEPFPRDDDGEKDHREAIEELGLGSTNRMNPTYVSDDSGDLFAIVGVNKNTGEVTLTDPTAPSVDETWTGYLEGVWNDWQHDGLTFRRQEFLAVEEETYNTETHASVRRVWLAELADYAANAIGDGLEHASDDLVEAVRHAYDKLDYDWEEDDE